MAAGKTRGQSVLEFALTVPVFLWLVMGIFDLGRAVASYSLLANCAREGARAAIFPQTSDADIIAAVNAQTLIMGTIPSNDITITPSTQSARTSGSNVTVQIVYRYAPLTPLLSTAVGSSITLSGTSTMLIE